VIRVSGAKAFRLLQNITAKRLKKTPNHVQVAWIKANGLVVDQALVVYMRAPHSYTGEDTIEISCHGSIAGLNKILAEIVRQGGRLAGAGEFTKRAFINGKLDLAQAEAVIDLIWARSEGALQNAAAQLEGWLGREVEEVREKIANILTGVEGGIDFPDDIREQKGWVRAAVAKELRAIKKLLATAEEGRIIREGARVVVIGRPNVGKSSLLNALVKNERAIVSRQAGTTRDTIEELIDLGGRQAVVIDTAGLRAPGNEIEKEGVARARAEIKKADLVVLVTEGQKGLTKADRAIIAGLGKQPAMVVANKVDLGDKGTPGLNYPQYKTSAKTGQGIERLLAGIKVRIKPAGKRSGGARVMINQRHKECLTRAEESLIRGLAALNRADYQELLAEDLKRAVVALGEVSGEAVSEEVIDRIFSRFCVGK
jgi:tRNA modification GTPase